MGGIRCAFQQVCLWLCLSGMAVWFVAMVGWSLVAMLRRAYRRDILSGVFATAGVLVAVVCGGVKPDGRGDDTPSPDPLAPSGALPPYLSPVAASSAPAEPPGTFPSWKSLLDSLRSFKDDASNPMLKVPPGTNDVTLYLGSYPFRTNAFPDLLLHGRPYFVNGVPCYDVRMKELLAPNRTFFAQTDDDSPFRVVGASAGAPFDRAADETWSRTVYGAPPAGLSDGRLRDWYEDRSRLRLDIVVTLVPSLRYREFTERQRALADFERFSDPSSTGRVFRAVDYNASRDRLRAHVKAGGTLDLFGRTDLDSEGPWTYLGRIFSSTPATYVNVVSTNASCFLAASPAARDGDGDGVSDGLESLVFGSDPANAQTAGSGVSDGVRFFTIGRGLFLVDSDDDGLNDGEEMCLGTDPDDPDSDGDGLPDGAEQDLGLDPNDPDENGNGVPDGEEPQIENGGVALGNPASSPDRTQWAELVGDEEEGVAKTLTQTVELRPDMTYLVGVFIASLEYPDYTGESSRFNDVLSWSVDVPGVTNLTQEVRVNNEDGAWDEAVTQGQSVRGASPVVLKDAAIVATGATDVSVTVELSATNVSDGMLPSSIHIGFFPLRVHQANMVRHPVGADGTTDPCTRYRLARIPRNGIAYITGEPSPARLYAKFMGLPEWMSVTWGGTLKTERQARRTAGIDDRTLVEAVAQGGDAYDVSRALADEIIGGTNTLTMTVQGLARGSHPFVVRGKNPTDAAARAYITANVDEEFRDFAWKIAKHESKSGRRVYNQFNPGGDKSELPNHGAPHGWGMAQIDRGANGDSTAELYNWKTNILSMAATLNYAVGRTRTFLGYYREAYGRNENWCEPPGTNVLGVAVSAEMWSVFVIYNGTQGIPEQRIGGHRFYSPLQFSPATGTWRFFSNAQNPQYVEQVIRDSEQEAIE